VVDQLALDYTGQPVVFLEHDVDNPVGARYSRWWAAAKSLAALPLAMVDSGNQTTEGYLSFYSVYSGMVDTSAIRPATAEVSATRQRIGDALRVEIDLTNHSGTTLGASNSATVHVLVYEESQVNLTGRFVHDAPWTSISPDLADGDSRSLVLDSAALSGVDWSKIQAVVLVEYRPGGASGPYDMLQAAAVQESEIFSDGFESGDLTAWSSAVP
jgi:hypothetical protein